MIADWPTSVPFCKIGEYDLGKVKNFVDENTQSGHTDSRLTSRRLMDVLKNIATPKMTSAQVDTFWEFYETTLDFGSSPFIATRFRNNADGTPHNKTYKFIEFVPREQRVGPNQYRIVFSIQEV